MNVHTPFRQTLPPRRFNQTLIVKHGVREFTVTFGRENPFPPFGRVTEVFCSGTEACRVGSDDQAQISDTCIAISLLLQRGMDIADLAEAFGEDRPERAETGPPSSPLGAIARAGAALQCERDPSTTEEPSADGQKREA